MIYDLRLKEASLYGCLFILELAGAADDGMHIVEMIRHPYDSFPNEVSHFENGNESV